MMKKTFFTRAILSIIGSIPLRVRRRIFIFLFQAFWHVSLRHRMITINNLAHAFPEKGMSTIITVAKGVYRHIAIVAAEIFELPSLTRSNIGDLVDLEGLEAAQCRMGTGRAILLFTGHFGNWELLAVSLALMVRPIAVVYRPLDSPVLENLICWIRTAHGNRMLPKERAMRSILRSVKEKEIVGILIDQNTAWQEGVFVDFFGRSACTTDGLALIARHTGVPVVPAFMVRSESGRYRLIVGDEIEIVSTDNRKRDVLANTQRFTRVIEDMVRQYPEQWLWIHQRWKTKEIQVRR